MTAQHLHDLLEDLADSRELVLRPAAPAKVGVGVDVDVDAMVAAWRDAASDARSAYLAWCAAPGLLAHAAYEAAEDRADAALAALVARAGPGDDPHHPRPLAA